MPWRSLTIETTRDTAERLADALMQAGADSVSIEDADAGTPAECAVFDEPGIGAGLWSRNRVIALFPESADVATATSRAADAAGISVSGWFVEDVADADWVRLTQSQFQPIRIADGLWIVPTWCEAPVPDAVNLVIDPGVAFGTGSHPTTRLCLRWLAEHLCPGESVLDYGCGSGILAIAAKRLGAGPVTGIDIDPQAVSAARQNAERNAADVRFFSTDAAPANPVDLVIANILTKPLVALAPLLAQRVRAGGRIVLSGILAAQADEVTSAYEPRFAISPAAADDGWVCLTGVRRDRQDTLS